MLRSPTIMVGKGVFSNKADGGIVRTRGRHEGQVMALVTLKRANSSSKQPSGAKISIDNKSEQVEVTGRSETDFSRCGWT